MGINEPNDTDPATNNEQPPEKGAKVKDTRNVSEPRKVDNTKDFDEFSHQKRDTGEKFGHPGAKLNSILSEIVNGAFPDIPEQLRNHFQAVYSKIFYNFKSIDRAVEPHLENYFSNKYQFLMHNHAQKTLIDEVMIKIHYHLCGYIHLLRVRAQTREMNWDVKAFLTYINDTLPAHMLKCDSNMAPLFEMMADYSPEQLDVTDEVRCYTFTDFKNHPLLANHQFLATGDAKYIIPDFQGMFRMEDRWITGIEEDKKSTNDFSLHHNLHDLKRGATKMQNAEGVRSYRNALFPLLPGQPYEGRDFIYGDPVSLGISTNSPTWTTFLAAKRSLIKSVGFPSPKTQGTINTIAEYCGLDESSDWVLTNQGYIFDSLFDGKNNSFANFAQLQRDTLAWKLETPLNAEIYNKILEDVMVQVLPGPLQAIEAERERINAKAAPIIESDAFRRPGASDAVTKVLHAAGTKFREFVEYAKTHVVGPKPHADLRYLVLDIIEDGGKVLQIDRSADEGRDAVGERIASYVRQSGPKKLWNDNIYVTPERGSKRQGLREFATYQTYHPAVGAHPKLRDPLVTENGPFYNKDHQPIRYEATLKNENGRYLSTVNGYLQTRAS